MDHVYQADPERQYLKLEVILVLVEMHNRKISDVIVNVPPLPVCSAMNVQPLPVSLPGCTVHSEPDLTAVQIACSCLCVPVCRQWSDVAGPCYSIKLCRRLSSVPRLPLLSDLPLLLALHDYSMLCVFFYLLLVIMAESSSYTVNISQTEVGGIRTENIPIQVTTIHLAKENYIQWSAAMTMWIAGRGRIAYINGRKIEPAETNVAWDTWFLEDNQVKTLIVNSVSPKIQLLILRKRTARDMWVILVQMYGQKKKIVRVYQLMKDVYSLGKVNTRELTAPVGANTGTCTPRAVYRQETTPVVAQNSMDLFIHSNGRALIHGRVNSKERYSAFPRTPRLGRREPTLQAQHTTVPWNLSTASAPNRRDQW
ncbi:hypothetical protein EJ110_NYTH35685 [Nymphaea thermarum]|nr:hypothetical protein EJ110_NYTH35685 [Nymphaea thermarum]